MSLDGVTTALKPAGFPRVSGDEPRPALRGKSWDSFSPRERG